MESSTLFYLRNNKWTLHLPVSAGFIGGGLVSLWWLCYVVKGGQVTFQRVSWGIQSSGPRPAQSICEPNWEWICLHLSDSIKAIKVVHLVPTLPGKTASTTAATWPCLYFQCWICRPCFTNCLGYQNLCWAHWIQKSFEDTLFETYIVPIILPFTCQCDSLYQGT